MTISIVIPAYNEEQYLPACLETVCRLQSDAVVEIIVVDNASDDRTAEVAASFPGVRVIREDHKGLTWARQRGLEVATGDLVAYIDADTRVQPHWFPMIHRQFGSDPSLVCLSGPYVYYDLSAARRRWTKAYWKYLARPVYSFTKYMVVGGNFVARRNALHQIGGFDHSIEFYGEDTNIARRLHQIGTVRFLPSFYIHASGRRLKQEGMLKTGTRYVANFLSEVILHKPVSKEYRDIR